MVERVMDRTGRDGRTGGVAAGVAAPRRFGARIAGRARGTGRRTGWVAGVVLGAALLGAPAPAAAQAESGQIRVDSIAIEGLERVPRDTVLNRLGITAGQVIGFQDLQRGEKAIMATGEFRDLVVRIEGPPGEGGTLVLELEEQPRIRRVVIQGLERADPDEVRDSSRLESGETYSPLALLRARQLIRSELADEGIPFATIRDELEPVEGMENVVDVLIDVDEGNRVAVAAVVVEGNEALSDAEIASTMATRPEGFWWFEGGGFEESAYELDLGQRIPQLYLSHGYLDFRILSDTIVVDPVTGKARLELEVEEGPQYRIARFDITGNELVEDERLEQFFLVERGGLLSSLGIGAGEIREVEQRGTVYDAVAYEAARQRIEELYRNEGHLWARVGLTTEKLPQEETEGEPMVAVEVLVQEGNPAFIRRIEIEGNDYTHEWVIRNQIEMLPGDVYSEQRLLNSYQRIQALGFFETPIPIPGIQDHPETGEVDIIFRVVEKQTGSVSFGTSVGGGVGLSGFIGYDHPNLFGQGKQGHLRWDFGRYLNNFSVSYQDPALLRSRVSGSISLFDSRDRYFQFQSGERKRIGGSLRFGFPVPGWTNTRVFTGYSLSRTSYEQRRGVDDSSVFGLPPGTQSQLSLALTRTTLNHPLFPTSGSRQSLELETNGGLLGGDGDFQKISATGTWRVPVGTLGARAPGAGGPTFTLGLSVRTGLLFGDASAFPFDRFWMGGVNFGEMLRGYNETTITPLGFFPEGNSTIADIDRLGDSFLSLTADYSLKLNDQVQLTTFFDAGNVWRDPRDIDPSQLFRGAGVGVQIVTPFGPLGLDYAYGFDKFVPGWQFHFRMGPGF